MKKILNAIILMITACSLWAMCLSVQAASKPGVVTISGFTSESNAVTVKWSGVSGASSYRVDRRRSGDDAYTTVKSGISGTSCKDTGLLAGTKYWYRVYAVNSAGTSAKPESKSAWTKPEMPTLKKYGSDSASTIKLEWQPVTGAESYRIDRRIDGVGEYSVYKTGLTATSYEDSGLQSGTRYCYRIYAVNEGGTSAKPAGTWVITRPDQPGNVSVATAGTDQIHVSWTGVKGAESYRIDRRIDGVGEYSVYQSGLTGTSFTDTGLNPDTRYCYRVYAVNANGASAKPAGIWGKTDPVVLEELAISIINPKTTMWDGEEYQLKASTSASWSSSNSAVASVNSNGILKAIKKGSATITASAGGKSASFTVTVDPITTGKSVSNGYYLIAYAGNTNYVLDVSGASLKDGANIHLYKRHDGTNQKFLFTYQNNGYYSIRSYCSGQAVNRNLSSGNVLQWPWHGGESEQWALESAGDGYFYIRSRSGNYLDNTGREIKDGNNIHTYKRNQSIAQKWKLIATDNSIPVKDLSLNKKKLELTVGETASLKETIIPSNATNKGVTWSSSNKKYATVDKTGKVKGIKAGDVTITVKSANGKTAACKITVIDPDTFVWPVGGNGGVWNGGIDYPRYVRSKAPHTGTDIQAKKGTAVRSAYAGKIVSMIEKRNSKGQFISFGRYIIVESKVNGKKVRIYYCHLSAFANVKVGQTIKAGTKIGKVGMTGNATGNHLHFEVRKWNGSVFKTVNPTPYLDKSKKGK